MKTANRIFSKEECILLRGILRGETDGAKGVPMRGYARSAALELANQGYQIDDFKVRSVVHELRNNQPVWRVIYALIEKDRPHLLRVLDEPQSVE